MISNKENKPKSRSIEKRLHKENTKRVNEDVYVESSFMRCNVCWVFKKHESLWWMFIFENSLFSCWLFGIIKFTCIYESNFTASYSVMFNILQGSWWQISLKGIRKGPCFLIWLWVKRMRSLHLFLLYLDVAMVIEGEISYGSVEECCRQGG